ncbi:histidine kinase, partial [Methylogaea oryzae]|uniref:histidine kinase n=1 Tax=Methylogaea oryzae TaxID=1295382 RepID=UPI0020D18E5C
MRCRHTARPGGIEQGDFANRLPDFSAPEFSRIAQAFNYMAHALEKAREENRALARHSLAIQEEERRHIAQELHDELGQSLAAIKAMAASLHPPVTHGILGQAADAITATCDHLFDVVRGMMRRLRPSLLDELGLTAALEDLLDGWRQRCPGIEWEFHGDDGVDDCAGNAKIQVFRIVQEA